jgi:hypothetical protein
VICLSILVHMPVPLPQPNCLSHATTNF